MTDAALKRKPKLKTFHATVQVTRTEQWYVEAATVEEARALLAAGQGHRSSIGDCLHFEIDRLDG